MADDEMDARTIAVEERCVALLALQAPVASDLRHVVAALRMSAEIERSADLVVNICKAARRIYGHELDPKLRGTIAKMGEQAQQLYSEAIDAYVETGCGEGRRDRRHGLVPRRVAEAVRADDLREPRRWQHRSPGRRAARRRGSLLRAHRRPRGERRRAGPLPHHRLDARARRRRPVPCAQSRRRTPTACRCPTGYPSPARPDRLHAGPAPDHRTGGGRPHRSSGDGPDPRAAPATAIDRRSGRAAVRFVRRAGPVAGRAGRPPDRGRAGGCRRRRAVPQLRERAHRRLPSRRRAGRGGSRRARGRSDRRAAAAARRSICSARRVARCSCGPTRSTAVRVVRW